MTPRRRVGARGPVLHTKARGLVGCLLALSVLFIPATVIPATAEPASGATGSVDLALAGVTPAAVTPHDTLAVAVHVHNGLATALPAGGRVVVSLHGQRLTSRDDVQEWIAGLGKDADRELPGPVALPALPPGATTTLRVTVPAGGLRLPAVSPDQFGPRGLVVTVMDAAGRPVARLRTVIVWWPYARFHPTRLSLLSPVTSATPSVDVVTDDATTADLARAGRLQRLLAAVADPDIAVALDPALLVTAQRLAQTGTAQPAVPASAGATPGPTPSETVPASPSSSSAQTATDGQHMAAEWLTAIRANARTRTMYQLPFADPDMTALAHRRAVPLLAEHDALGQVAARAALGAPLKTTLALPADGAADPATIGMLAAAGRGTVVLAAGTQPTAKPLTYTPTGRSRLAVGPRTVDGLLYDEQLSKLVTAAGAAGSGSAPATQQLLAELAAITLERPSDVRHVLAVTPRAWNPDPPRMQALMRTLRSLPWVGVAGLSELLAADPVPRVGPIEAPAARMAELPGPHVTTVEDLLHQANRFSPVLSDPESVIGPLRESLLSLASTAWRSDLAGLPTARAPVANAVTSLVRGVHIVRGSRINFIATTAALPVTVENDLPYPVHVVVVLKPRSGRLVVQHSVGVDLPANTRRQVRVPTRAVANGDVDVLAELRTSTDGSLDVERVLHVRVRRTWETGGIIAIGVVLAVLLAVGLLRGMRRERTRVPPESVPDVDDIATASGPPSGPISLKRARPDEVPLADAAEAAETAPSSRATREPL